MFRGLGWWHPGAMSMTCVLLAVGVGMAGCGGGGGSTTEEPASAEQEALPPPVAAIRLRVQLFELPAAMRGYVNAWAEKEGIEVDFDLSDAPLSGSGEPPALVEVDAFEFRRLASGERLRAFGASGEKARRALLGGDAGLWSDQTLGLAWRGEVHGIVIPRGAAESRLQWSSLARWCDANGGLATPTGASPSLLGLFLGARWTAGGDLSGEDVSLLWSGEPAVEAMSFVQRLSRRAERRAPAAIVEDLKAGRIAATVLDSGFLDAVEAAAAESSFEFLPFPTSDGSEVGVCWIRPRLLVLPRGGVHRDLAEELAILLSDLDAAHLLAETSKSWALPMMGRLPTGTTVGGSALRARILPLRHFARVLPAEWSSPVTERVIVDATDATLSLRRSPEDALADAAARWNESERDDR